MKYYLDITLLPDAEANLGFLWHKVYQQIHIALVENSFDSNEVIKGKGGQEEAVKKSRVGISFPKYGDTSFFLGDKLRLFAQTKEQLQQFNVGKWLNRLTDYTHCTSIKDVPSDATFVCFKRKQFKSLSKINADVEKCVLKLSEEQNKPIEDVRSALSAQKYDAKYDLPFVHMSSLSSTKKRFRLFFEKEKVASSLIGTFNCYGLSGREADKQATVPWFK